MSDDANDWPGSISAALSPFSLDLFAIARAASTEPIDTDPINTESTGAEQPGDQPGNGQPIAFDLGQVLCATGLARAAAHAQPDLSLAGLLSLLDLDADPAKLAARLGEAGLLDVIGALSSLGKHVGSLLLRAYSALVLVPPGPPPADVDSPAARGGRPWTEIVRSHRASTVAALTGVSPYVASVSLSRAPELAPGGRLAGVGAAVHSGRLSVAAAERIADDLTAVQDDRLAADIAAAVLPVAPTLGARRLREAVRAEIAQHQPVESTAEIVDAAAARTVTRPVDEGGGLASMQLLGPAPALLHLYGSARARAQAELARQEAARADGLIEAGEVDSIGALCFDALFALVDEANVGTFRRIASADSAPGASQTSAGTAIRSGGARTAAGYDASTASSEPVTEADAGTRTATGGTGIGTSWVGWRPLIQVIVPISTLLGMDDQPAELDGFGPLDAETARLLAADPSGRWTRLVTDQGRVVKRSRLYRPPRSMADLVKARDRTCRFPGCRRTRIEVDHIVEFAAGGYTEPANLACLCRSHHNLKTHRLWDYRLDPATGDAIWTDLHGNTARQPATRYRTGTDIPGTLVRRLVRPPRRHRKIAAAMQRIQLGRTPKGAGGPAPF